MTRGGPRKGSGRKPDPFKKKKYATKLRPDLITWLQAHKPAARHIEAALDRYIKFFKQEKH